MEQEERPSTLLLHPSFAYTKNSGCHCLRLVDLHVPGAVRSGEPVQLRCEYDLESAELYSVKWYKNNVEFYRYLPSDVPPGQSYELLGTFVDVPAKYETRAGTTRHENGLQSTSVTLHFDVRPDHVARGSIRFKCTSSVTQAHSRSSEELVIGDKGPPSGRALQESNSPRILSEKSRYEVGDNVDVNCTSVLLKENPVELRWFVNDHEAQKADVVRYSNVEYSDGTKAVVLGLRFRVEARHFSDSDGLRLKCTATQTRVVQLSSEEVVQGAHQRSSGFHVAADDASSLHNRGVSRLLQWWWIFEVVLVVIAFL
ncbi:uncharacterized protein ISCGN_017992 [Ixodes scapularis]